MMVKWNWRKSRIIFFRENEHLAVFCFFKERFLVTKFGLQVMLWFIW